MAEAGILSEDDRVALIAVELADMTLIEVSTPVRVDESNEPQSDVPVIRAWDYRESPPCPEDVPLLI